MLGMTRAEYEKLKRKINDECQRKLEALETVWDLAGDAGAVRTVPTAATPPPTPSVAEPAGAHRPDAEVAYQQLQLAANGRMEVLSLVRANVLPRADEFTMNHVYEAIISEHPGVGGILKKPSITSALTRLVELGDLKLIEKGSGKRPSKFMTKRAYDLARERFENED